jgi:hypothetical protein
MHAVIRTYSGPGAKELFDHFEKNKDALEKIIRGVKGVVSYALVRTADGGTSITIAEDKAGTDESVKVAREWVAANVPKSAASAPAIAEGTTIVLIK